MVREQKPKVSLMRGTTQLAVDYLNAKFPLGEKLEAFLREKIKTDEVYLGQMFKQDSLFASVAAYSATSSSEVHILGLWGEPTGLAKVFSLIHTWAENNGKQEIRGEANDENTIMLYEAFRFKKISTNMQLKLGFTVEGLIQDSPEKEPDDDGTSREKEKETSPVDSPSVGDADPDGCPTDAVGDSSKA